MMLLSVLRCGQFALEHGFSMNWMPFRTADSARFDPASYRCVHSYTIELLSTDPLVIYINNFLNNDEVEHLLGLA